MASGDTLFEFFPCDNEPPSSNYATASIRNGHPILEFDQTTQEMAVFTYIMPRHYTSAADIVIYIHAMLAAGVTTGTLGWTVELERMSDNTLDLDGDGFATALTVTATTVPGTSGVVLVLSGTLTTTHLDAVTAGDSFRLRIKRDVSNDNAAGDAQLIAVEGKQA